MQLCAMSTLSVEANWILQKTSGLLTRLPLALQQSKKVLPEENLDIAIYKATSYLAWIVAKREEVSPKLC